MSARLDWSNARSADGPRVAAWLRQRLRDPHRMSIVDESVDALTNTARRVRAWEKGENPSVWTLDEHLMRLGVHLSELPDEVWRASAAKDHREEVTA
jgi:hypothetical protein